MNIDKRVLLISKKLGINRSQVAEKAIVREIALKLKTLSVDIEDLVTLSKIYQIETKRTNDQMDLEFQKIEQAEWEKQHGKQIQIETEQKLITEFNIFCSDHQLPEITFAGYITGSVDDWKDYSSEEYLLFSELEKKELCPDKNRVREIIKSKIIMVRK